MSVNRDAPPTAVLDSKADGHIVEIIEVDVFKPVEPVFVRPTAFSSFCCLKFPSLLNWGDLSGWQQDNEFITGEYRPELTLRQCVASLFYPHNESGNIWTHLIGFIGFLGLVAYTAAVQVPNLERLAEVSGFRERLNNSIVTTFIFLVCCLVMFGASTTLHTFWCMSSRAGAVCTRLDYIGIAAMILGSNIPLCYHFFLCQLEAQIAWMSLLSAAAVLACVISCLDFFATPRFRPLRVAVFAALGLVGIGPGVHFGFSPCYGEQYCSHKAFFLILLAGMGACFLVGAAIYALRIPERWLKNKCNILGQSHQIFHTFVVIGASFQYFNVIFMTRLSFEYQLCSPPTVTGTPSNASLVPLPVGWAL